jgi:hypothetical protein
MIKSNKKKDSAIDKYIKPLKWQVYGKNNKWEYPYHILIASTPLCNYLIIQDYYGRYETDVDYIDRDMNVTCTTELYDSIQEIEAMSNKDKLAKAKDAATQHYKKWVKTSLVRSK